MSLPTSNTYLTRMRGNAAQALQDGATPADLLLAVALVTRGHNRPTPADLDDADELADHLDALNTFRTGARL